MQPTLTILNQTIATSEDLKQRKLNDYAASVRLCYNKLTFSLHMTFLSFFVCVCMFILSLFHITGVVVDAFGSRLRGPRP
jgi:hypothetical protein